MTRTAAAAAIDSLMVGFDTMTADQKTATFEAIWKIAGEIDKPAESPSDLIDDGIGLRARGGLVYFG